MILLIDILKMQGITLGKYKVHLATIKNSLAPLEAYLAGWFQQWQEEQTQQNFRCDSVLSLIQMERGGKRWLFGGVYQILGVEKGTDQPWKYHTELRKGQEDLIGRIVVEHKRAGRASYVWGDKQENDIVVAEVFDAPYTVERFPGYNAVIVSHERLQLIVKKQDHSWKTALSIVGGVYLIVDTSTGKPYVGIATGSGGFWQRWCAYADNGHGGNVELKVLLAQNGTDHTKHFQYSILEIADLQKTPDQMIDRECHWKKALQSRVPFGLNLN